MSVVALIGCAAERAIVIENSADMRLTLLDANTLNSPGEIVSGAPAKIPLADLKGRVLRIEAKERVTQYWYFDGWEGERTTLRPILAPVPVAAPAGRSDGQGGKNDAAASADNMSHRLVMKAQMALMAHQYDEARRTADSLERLAPRLAAPHIIKGLAFMQQDQREAARSAFRVAKTLDPQDTEIDQLLQLVP